MTAFKNFYKFAFAMFFLSLSPVLDLSAQTPAVRLPRPS